jgi:hypothetical protein
MEGNIEGVKNDLRAIGVDSVTDEIAKDLMALVFDFHEAGYFITEKKLIRAIGTMTWGEKRTLYFDNH